MVSLATAPLAAPAAAQNASAMVAMDDGAMAKGMPCCPDQSKDCQSCPVLALCLLSISLPAPSGAASLIARNSLRHAPALSDDLRIDGLGANPPDHPPRILV
jgi:hypothetical protein